MVFNFINPQVMETSQPSSEHALLQTEHNLDKSMFCEKVITLLHYSTIVTSTEIDAF